LSCSFLHDENKNSMPMNTAATILIFLIAQI